MCTLRGRVTTAQCLEMARSGRFVPVNNTSAFGGKAEVGTASAQRLLMTQADIVAPSIGERAAYNGSPLRHPPSGRGLFPIDQ